MQSKSRFGFPGGLIIREREPVNFESPFEQMDGFITPTELFYIRSHFPVPDLERETYRLRIDGAVTTPFELSYDALRELPAETQVATLECAGNGRIFLLPQVEGTQWELGAVGTAKWTGVPLRVLLNRAGLAADAAEVVFEGADRGIPKEKPNPPQAISYARSLPLSKATAPEVLVAYEMNERDLTREHGFPVRLIVPGYYGMASVKWLERIRVVREKFQGYWQTTDYAYWDELAGQPVRRPLSSSKLKAQIARPKTFEAVEAGQRYLISGAAWSGESQVSSVAVSTNGGKSWHNARFLDEVQQFAWRRWEFDWLVPQEPGRCKLMARATDAEGNTQPKDRDSSYGTYAICHQIAIEVFIQHG